MSDEFKIIKGTLNCSRITKSRLFTKEGKDGKYLRIVLIRKKALDQYGQVQYMIKEDVTKEEREAGKDGEFIGDASAVKPKNPAPAPKPAEAEKEEDNGDVPF